MMTTNLYKDLKAESLKIKKTITYWFTLGTSIFFPLIVFLICIFEPNHFIPKEGENPWELYFQRSFSIIASLFFQFYIILIVALNLNIEHKENSWKKLFLLPISRKRIYLNKALFILLQIASSLFLFFIAILVLGFILGIVYQELKFLKYSPNIYLMLKLLSGLFISIFAVFSIQYVLSLFFKNMIISIAIGMFCAITGQIITLEWKCAIYFPYSFSSIFYHNQDGKLNLKNWYGITEPDLLNLLIIIIIMLVGYWLFKRKQLK